MNKEQNNGKINFSAAIVIAIIVVVVAVVVIFCAAFFTADKNTPADDTLINTNVDSVVETDATEVETTKQSYGDMLAEYTETTTLETPHMTFDYPADWADKYSIEQGETENGYEISFNGTGSFEGYTFFAVCFGEGTDEYFQLGDFTTEEGTVGLYTFVNEDTSICTDDDMIAQHSELQSGVNDIIVQIQENENFVSMY